MFEWLWDWCDYFLDLVSWTRLGKGNILLLGLDNAGKTTLLSMLKSGKLISTVPTRSMNKETVTINNISFQTIDLGGQENLRRMWEDYMCEVAGIIYLVDSADVGRLRESEKVLKGLLLKEQVDHCPILVLANKRDRKGSIPAAQIAKTWKIQTTGKKKTRTETRPVEFFDVSMVAAKSNTFSTPFSWFAYQLKYVEIPE